MGLYGRYLLLRIIRLACGAEQIARQRERVVAGAAGRVLEVGIGSGLNNSSGDYVIAFSTAEEVRRVRSDPAPRVTPSLLNAQMSLLLAAVAEATAGLRRLVGDRPGRCVGRPLLGGRDADPARGRQDTDPGPRPDPRVLHGRATRAGPQVGSPCRRTPSCTRVTLLRGRRRS